MPAPVVQWCMKSRYLWVGAMSALGMSMGRRKGSRRVVKRSFHQCIRDSRDHCTLRHLPAVCESVPLIARVVAGGAGYPCRGWRPMPSCPVSPGLDLQASFGLRPRFFSGRRVTGTPVPDVSEGAGVALMTRPSPISCARTERRAA